MYGGDDGARTRDLCRDRKSKAGNSLESGGTDGSFQRPEELLATLIAPLSHPRPLPYKPLPEGHEQHGCLNRPKPIGFVPGWDGWPTGIEAMADAITTSKLKSGTSELVGPPSLAILICSMSVYFLVVPDGRTTWSPASILAPLRLPLHGGLLTESKPEIASKLSFGVGLPDGLIHLMFPSSR